MDLFITVGDGSVESSENSFLGFLIWLQVFSLEELVTPQWLGPWLGGVSLGWWFPLLLVVVRVVSQQRWCASSVRR